MEQFRDQRTNKSSLCAPATAELQVPEQQIKRLKVAEIRRTPETQQRLRTSPGAIREYAEAMKSGAIFPPVTVWWDGGAYWLSDGYHRLAAAELANVEEISASVYEGSLSQAIWHSLGANSIHGLRRTAQECRMVLSRALAHPSSASVSNVQLAKHLGIPETTIRRWRNKLVHGPEPHGIRTVTRAGTKYSIDVSRIGCSRQWQTTGPAMAGARKLAASIHEMKESAIPEIRLLLNIIDK